MSLNKPITEADLHAYVDNQLPPGRREAVEAHLSSNADDNALVTQLMQLNQDLLTLYDELPENNTLPLRARRQESSSRWRIAAAAAWLSLGALIGWQTQLLFNPVTTQQDSLASNLSQPAALAHQIYAAEVRHPVEVPGSKQAHLQTWLSHRMKAQIKAPDLDRAGFSLVGGRLLPSTDQMAGQFMYERDDGQRVTLYMRQGDWRNEQTAFRFSQSQGVTLFYWIDGPLGYALVGDLERDQLYPLAHLVYQQLHLSLPVQPNS